MFIVPMIEAVLEIGRKLRNVDPLEIVLDLAFCTAGAFMLAILVANT